MDYMFDNVAEATVALDPLHDVAPVRMMQALQGHIHALEAHAAQIVKNEVKPTVADNSGVLQPVVDEGGRHALTSMVLDMQTVARSLDEKARADLEKAAAGAETSRVVGPESLVVPTNKPLDSFDARTWPASYVEWWFGDGAPNLERDRPMLFEEVARRLINMEELQYSLPTDAHPYVASCRSRFASPEIIAVLGGVIRRLRLLRGTKAAVGRKGFSADLKAHAEASEEDFMIATNIAKPGDSIITAASRPDMPAKVKTAFRTLLLSTSDVPGTEGRKTALRYDGHGNNIFFGPASFFNTPNLADTYNYLMVQLHQGPPQDSHLDITARCDASQIADLDNTGRATHAFSRTHASNCG